MSEQRAALAPADASGRPVERRTLLAGAAGAAAAWTLVGGQLAQAAAPDAAAVTRLLRAERRLISLYDAALKRDLLPAELARHLRDQEQEHARGLEQALAGLGVRPPAGAAPLPELPHRPRDFPAFALQLEDELVAAYVETIASLRRPGLIAPLGSIAANEGAHQVILRELAGLPPLD
jgi:Ferritin-like domain